MRQASQAPHTLFVALCALFPLTVMCFGTVHASPRGLLAALCIFLGWGLCRAGRYAHSWEIRLLKVLTVGALLISAVAIVEDVKKCVSMDAKKAQNLILIVGETKNELGGSHYYLYHNELGANVPRVDLQTAPKVVAALAQAIEAGLVTACHDCSEGGLAVAAAEMAFSGGLGMEINLDAVPLAPDVRRNDQILFSESTTRFLVEIAPENFGRFARLCQNIRFGEIGRITAEPRLVIRNAGHKTVVDAACNALKESWQKPLRW